MHRTMIIMAIIAQNSSIMGDACKMGACIT